MPMLQKQYGQSYEGIQRIGRATLQPRNLHWRKEGADIGEP